jgi:hypothetical protein
MAKPKKFIQKAVPKSRKGVFAAKAKKAGMSTRAYAQKKAHAPGKLGKEARLAKVLMNLRGTIAE